MREGVLKRLGILLVSLAALLVSRSAAMAAVGDQEYAVYTAVLLHVKQTAIEDKASSKELRTAVSHSDSLSIMAQEAWSRSMYGSTETYGTVIDETIKGHIDEKSLRYLNYLKEESGGMLEEGLIDGFNLVNQKSEMLNGQSFGLPLDIVTVPRKEFDRFFKSDKKFKGWDRFYEKYPKSDGIIRFSRVAFDQDTTMALVLHDRQIHYVGGSGYYFLLKKVNGEWFVVKQMMSRVS